MKKDLYKKNGTSVQEVIVHAHPPLFRYTFMLTFLEMIVQGFPLAFFLVKSTSVFLSLCLRRYLTHSWGGGENGWIHAFPNHTSAK